MYLKDNSNNNNLQESDLDMQCDSDEEEMEKPVEKKVEIYTPLTNEPIKQLVFTTYNYI